jgi:hypothetical protein
MFKRNKSGLSKSQRALFARYARAVGGGPLVLTQLDAVPQGERAELASALDVSGTADERRHFIEVEVAVVINTTAMSLHGLRDARAQLAIEAIDGWPTVREFPFFAGMRRSMVSDGRDADVVNGGAWLSPDSNVTLIVWYSAYGGDEPRSLWDLKDSGRCLDSFKWLLRSRAALRERVQREIDSH